MSEILKICIAGLALVLLLAWVVVVILNETKRAIWREDHKGGIATGGWYENINAGERTITAEQLRDIYETLADTHAQRNEAKEQAELNYQQVQEAWNNGRHIGHAG